MTDESTPPREPTDWEKRWSRLMRRRKVTYTIGGVLLIALISVSLLLSRELSLRFPHLDPGSYLGVLRPSSGGEPLKFYVERATQGQDILLVMFGSGWEPQLISGVLANAGDPNSELLPIGISGGGKNLTLTGASSAPHRYEGSYSLVREENHSREEGHWELSDIGSVPQELSEADKKEVQLWLLLRDELSETEEKVRSLESKVPAQRAEIDKLTVFITEGERLKTRANEKFTLLSKELSEAKDAFARKQEEAQKLQDTLTIAQKVSGMGRLVSLSRESLERESRWIDSMVRTGTTQSPEDLEAAYERAERIILLKRDINKEKARIDDLLHGKKKDAAPPEEEPEE